MGSETKTFRTLLTAPNGLSVVRLLGVPLFLWLVLGLQADGWALLVLAVSGFTDWLDGQLARAWRQTSRLGELLDPAADRLYILAVVVGLSLRGIIPMWFAGLLLLRDVVLLSCGPLLRRYGYGTLPVHFLGKAATFNLLYAFPLLLLGGAGTVASTAAKVIGWAFAIWGFALYWWAAVLYVVQVRQLVRVAREGSSAGAADTGTHGTGASETGGSATPSAGMPVQPSAERSIERPTGQHAERHTERHEKQYAEQPAEQPADQSAKRHASGGHEEGGTRT